MFERHIMIQELRPALILVLLMTALTGLIYPLTMTGLAQIAFPDAANGSLIVKDGKVIGSGLIAQSFTRPEYFHPRPSAVKYDASSSGGSNAAASSKDFIAAITRRVNALRTELNDRQIPIELVTTSGSGLDPHLSYRAADVQVERIARARNMKEGDIETLIINPLIEDRTFSFLGERRVNVLKLNLALDAFRENNTTSK
jgi:potassium-transporting ATPase KdpC subunit